jgi:hypothetical protein
MSKSCQKVVKRCKKLSKSSQICKKIATKLQKVVKSLSNKMSSSCQSWPGGNDKKKSAMVQ